MAVLADREFVIGISIGMVIQSHGGLSTNKAQNHCLFRILLDVVALQLNKLLEPESTERHAASRVLPTGPG